MLKIYHYSKLTDAEVDRLNNRETGGWDSEPRFARYADITTDGKPAAVLIGLLEKEYELVATVDSDSLDDGFHYTNHIEHNWAEEPAIHVTPVPGQHRSTSVGDIIVRDGETYIVASFGFTLLTAESK